ncbi:unnamed protein product [Lactuca saligna]|uniref:Secreted protein n=1 Tax=Lactuca saligna TaxID=75948 RepID=A0AA35YPM4_LACSI|nr:unnamed protein product [Lactuca saligna]
MNSIGMRNSRSLLLLFSCVTYAYSSPKKNERIIRVSAYAYGFVKASKGSDVVMHSCHSILLEQMKNYKPLEDGRDAVDRYMIVMNKDHDGYCRLYSRDVANRLIKKCVWW